MGSNHQAPTITQILSLRMLQTWGYEKFTAHVDRVADFYRKKRDVFERSMHKHLTGLAEWNTPQAGLFFWSVHLFAYLLLEHGRLRCNLTQVQAQGSALKFRRCGRG